MFTFDLFSSYTKLSTSSIILAYESQSFKIWILRIPNISSILYHVFEQVHNNGEDHIHSYIKSLIFIFNK